MHAGPARAGPARWARQHRTMHNIEYKAELRDIDLARSICRALKAAPIITMEQVDTYYRIPSGRLKKRECAGEPTEYIFYDRPDRTRPKLSHFVIYTEPQALERFGTSPLPVWVTVRKRRELYMHRQVRIHLDTVEGLGQFLEFEAMVSVGFNIAKCHEAVEHLKRAFGPALGEPIACGYSDLLAAEHDLKPEPNA